MKSVTVPFLYRLAGLYGIQTAYYDVSHRRQQASSETLVAMLRVLGASLEVTSHIQSAFRERRQSVWRRVLEPVIVFWRDRAAVVDLRLPMNIADAPVTGQLSLEDSTTRSWEWPASTTPSRKGAVIEGVQYAVRSLSLPPGIPQGYHELTVTIAGTRADSRLIVAPQKAHCPSPDTREWGTFLPLYSLYTQEGFGTGSYTDLGELAAWTARLGGSTVATLPMLAAYLDQPFDPSPYSPVSRLFWNDFFVDISRAPGLEDCPTARAMLASAPLLAEMRQLREAPLVDYARIMRLKRNVLEELSRSCFDNPSLTEPLDEFRHGQPLVEDYARFRAITERQESTWQSWPQPLRDGLVTGHDYDRETARYHLYAQWLATRQVHEVAATARAEGTGLHLDLALGVHPGGFDTWRFKDIFMRGVSVGAPPDAAFTGGQNWGFPPLHPDRQRERGYNYFAGCLRHQLHLAKYLRIDHVMGFHRLFAIPEGMEASQGVYLRYPAEEYYAMLALESQRHRASIVGEDLGTVQGDVRPAMARHGLHRTYVVEYEMTCRPGDPLPPVLAESVASLNTHDMATFASFWEGYDLGVRQSLGLIKEENREREFSCRHSIRDALIEFIRERQGIDMSGAEPQELVRALMGFLGESRTHLVLVNLEDLWGETRDQNVPGTAGGANWRRKARYGLEQFSTLPGVLNVLRDLDRSRKQSPLAADGGLFARKTG